MDFNETNNSSRATVYDLSLTYDDNSNYQYNNNNDESHHAHDTNNGTAMFSQQQLLALQITGVIFGLLSAISSSYIVYLILSPTTTRKSKLRSSNNNNNRKRKNNNLQSVYQRLILGLSCYDILVSLGAYVIFGPFHAVPQTDIVESFVYNPSGNWTTCSINGFFMTMNACTVSYSIWLNHYYLFSIRFGVREEKLAKYMEPIPHIVSPLVAIVAAIIALKNQYINPLDFSPGICWVGPYPPDCRFSWNNDTVECIRGEGSIPLSLLGGGIVAMAFLSTVAVFLLILQKVHETEKKMNLYAGNQFDSTTTQQKRDRLKMTKKTAIQGAMYAGALLVTFVPIIVTQIFMLTTPVTEENKTLAFLLCLSVKIFPPSQGIMNCYIYVYRKGNRSRRNNDVSSSDDSRHRKGGNHHINNSSICSATVTGSNGHSSFTSSRWQNLSISTKGLLLGGWSDHQNSLHNNNNSISGNDEGTSSSTNRWLASSITERVHQQDASDSCCYVSSKISARVVDQPERGNDDNDDEDENDQSFHNDNDHNIIYNMTDSDLFHDDDDNDDYGDFYDRNAKPTTRKTNSMSTLKEVIIENLSPEMLLAKSQTM